MSNVTETTTTAPETSTGLSLPATFDPVARGHAIQGAWDKWQAAEGKAEDLGITVAIMLKAAKAEAPNFTAFVKAHCKFTLSTANRILAVADGKGDLIREQEKARRLRREDRLRLSHKAPETTPPASVHTDKTSASTAPRELTDDEAKARMAALADPDAVPSFTEAKAAAEPPKVTDAPPTQPDAPTATTAPAEPSWEEMSDDALSAFKKACFDNCPKLTPPDLKQAVNWFNGRMWAPQDCRGRWLGKDPKTGLTIVAADSPKTNNKFKGDSTSSVGPDSKLIKKSADAGAEAEAGAAHA